MFPRNGLIAKCYAIGCSHMYCWHRLSLIKTVTSQPTEDASMDIVPLTGKLGLVIW